MEEGYRKDLSHTTWAKVFARQEQRAEQAREWLDALAAQPGDRVLDIGSGPGYVSLLAAERVGPAGLVYAVDRSAEALAYLEQKQAERGVPQIHRVLADALTLSPPEGGVDAALMTMMLHHADDAATLVRHVAQLVPPGVPVVVAEFHPEGPCEDGAPREHRVSPATVQAWCEAAGLVVREYRRQSPEHYMFLLERAADQAERG